MSNTVTRKCKECFEKFQAKIKELNRGNAKFCSRSCAVSYNNKQRCSKKLVECSYCGEEFKCKKSRLENKSGTLYCCREHKDKAQRIDSHVEQLSPSHYDEGKATYRQRALREQSGKPKCNRCKKELPKPILQIHHKDRNRDNNNLNNLEVLCPNCHVMEHYKAEDGWFK
jgi:hypothetical protein